MFILYLEYIAIGLLSPITAFISSARDGLMYDVRVVRGVHRLKINYMIISFFIYSIILSSTQYLINSSLCQTYTEMNVQQYFNNQSQKIYLSEKCQHFVPGINYLWLLIMFFDFIYIYFLIVHIDYTSSVRLVDKINSRLNQRRRFIFSFLILILRLIAHLIRCILIGTTGQIMPILMSTFLVIMILFNVFIHFRAIFIYNFSINFLKSKHLTDDNEDDLLNNLRDTNDEDEDDSSDDEKTEKKNLILSLPSSSKKNKKKKYQRPKTNIGL